MIAKIADWFLLVATTFTLIAIISIIYLEKIDFLDMKKMNPDVSASKFFSTVVLSPLVSTIVVGLIIVVVVLNVAKEFYIKSLKNRIIINLVMYSLSVLVTVRMYFKLDQW